MKAGLPLIVTPGEPGGVGCEILAKAWRVRKPQDRPFFAIWDEAWFTRLSDASRVGVPVKVINHAPEAADVFGDALPILHRTLPVAPEAGRFVKGTAPWVMMAIEEAVDICLAGDAAGIVTCPIQKEALYDAGFKYQGHTDYLGALARTRGHEAQDVMMLASAELRAVPVTVHIALKDVPSVLTQEMIITQARVVDDALRRFFGITAPRLAITGLNPHAGENGAMGREEITTIIPAIAALKREGLKVLGPLPADTAFHQEARANYDAILCMYHDQALIPAKTLDFHGGVNVTLGLPFIRTSPDHGTALGLAGKGVARADSLVAALAMAAQMADRAS